MRNREAEKQTWSADTYAKHARFVSDLAGDVLAWLAPKSAEHILDLGCGDGALTEILAESGAEVIGIDSGEDMVKAARMRGLDARLADAERLTFDHEFDAVFSNAALHWMTNPRLVLQSVARALKPNGRFVAEFGGHGNVAAIITAMRAAGTYRGGNIALAGPWFFPTAEEYRALLEESGFRVKRIGLYPRPTPLKTGMKAWLMVFRGPFFEQFGGDRDEVLEEVEQLLKPVLCDQNGHWTADYVRLRVEAQKS